MELGILLRLVDVMNLKFISFHPFNIQGREPYLCDFVEKTLTLVCIQTFADQFQLGVMIETAKLYILISVWMTLTVIQSHSCIRN